MGATDAAAVLIKSFIRRSARTAAKISRQGNAQWLLGALPFTFGSVAAAQAPMFPRPWFRLIHQLKASAVQCWSLRLADSFAVQVGATSRSTPALAM